LETKTKRPVIPLLDYLRIFRVMNAVVTSIGNDSNKTCLFFCVTGAVILKRFYGKKARVLVGSAYYLLDDVTSSVLAITKFEDGQLSKGIIESGRDGFHAWLECEGQIIDFQAPIFPEAHAQNGSLVRIQRKMFQRSLDGMGFSPDQLEEVGDFYLVPNLALTNLLVPEILGHQLSLDLLNICVTWYVKPPKAIPRRFAMMGDTGNVVQMELSNIDLSGAW
jgi:hypothetical protein